MRAVSGPHLGLSSYKTVQLEEGWASYFVTSDHQLIALFRWSDPARSYQRPGIRAILTGTISHRRPVPQRPFKANFWP